MTRIYLNPPVAVLLPSVLEWVHMHIHCLRVTIAGCFKDFPACSVVNVK